MQPIDTKLTKTLSLEDRASYYEKRAEDYINYNEYIMVRIDGKNFKGFTRGFNKPFDENLIYAFRETTKDLMKHYGAVSAFYQSDEITLVLPPMFKEELIEIKTKEQLLLSINEDLKVFKQDKEINSRIEIENHLINIYINDMVLSVKDYVLENEIEWLENIDVIFKEYKFYKEVITNNQVNKGRIQKMVSEIASLTTTSFNRHLFEKIQEIEVSMSDNFKANEEDDKYIKNFYEKKFLQARFDTRIFGVPSKEEVFNMVMFRTRDCVKNSKAMFCQNYCSHNSLKNKNTDEMVKFCIETQGKDWNEIEDYKKYGIIFKKEKYIKETKEYGDVERRRFVEISKQMTTYNDENVNMIVSKLYNG